MNCTPNPLLLATPIYAQLSFLSRWSGAPEPDRWAATIIMRAVIIVFVASLASVVHGQSSNALGNLPPPSKTLPERYYVMEAALRYMLITPSSQGGKTNPFSAYVLPKDGEFTPELVAAFAGSKPQVTAAIGVVSDEKGARDKATGQPVMLWSAKITKMSGDAATAYVSWYSAPLGGGGHTLRLRHKAGKWIVESEKSEWIS